MTEPRKLGRHGKQGVLMGQAGVWSVAAQLAIRGITPLFPGVDYGVDLVTDSGLRLQVKVASITYPRTANYPNGAYCFNLRRSARMRENQGWKRADMRTYAGVADYFVLWGIDEDRFWIAPTTLTQCHLWFGRRNSINLSKNVTYMNKIRDQRLLDMEDRWDLLDVNTAVKSLVEDKATKQVLQENL